MHRGYAFSFVAAASVLAAASAAEAATVLSVNPSSLCGAGGCFSDTQRTFQRTWSASDFAGATAISALALDRSLLGSMQDYAVRVSFQDANGNTVGNWGAFTVAVLSGQVVTLGGQALAWDASMGDLTLKLELLIPDRAGAGGGGGFGGFGGGGGGGGGGFAAAGGIGPAAFAAPPRLGAPSMANMPAAELLPSILAVPEPGAWALMLMGFMGAGAMLRRQRATPLKV